MYLKKKELVEWLEQRAGNLHWGARQVDHHEIIDKIESGAFDATPSNNIESPKPDLKPRDIVRHRTNKALVKGVVRSISKSGERAQVVWDRKDNPQLPYWETHWAYYRIRLLEKIGDAGMEKGAEG